VRILIGGPDGAGKSTVADLLSERLAGTGLTIQRIHYRPHLLFGTSPSTPAYAVSDPHARSSRGVATSFLKLLATFADTACYEIIRRLRPTSADVVIQERGWWDQAVDPRRYRLHRLARLPVLILGRMLPRAQLAVVLTGSAALIHQRKPELSVIEVARQAGEWTRWAPVMARQALVVDVTEPADDIVSVICRAIGSP
jgi:hypothetical protein